MNIFRAVIWLASGMALSATVWAGGIAPGPVGGSRPAAWSGRMLRFEVVKPDGLDIGPGCGQLDLNHLSLLTPAAKVLQPSPNRLNEQLPVKSASDCVEQKKTMAPADTPKASVPSEATKAQPVRYPVAPVKTKAEK